MIMIQIKIINRIMIMIMKRIRISSDVAFRPLLKKA
jgi:hypothetical protein